MRYNLESEHISQVVLKTPHLTFSNFSSEHEGTSLLVTLVLYLFSAFFFFSPMSFSSSSSKSNHSIAPECVVFKESRSSIVMFTLFPLHILLKYRIWFQLPSLYRIITTKLLRLIPPTLISSIEVWIFHF